MLVKDIKTIIWSYLSIRRMDVSLVQAKNELLAFLYKSKAGESADREVVAALENDSPFVDVFSRKEKEYLLENYREAVEACLMVEGDYREIGEFSMPKEIAEFVYGLLGKPEGLNVYNPFSGLGSFSLAFKGNTINGDEINKNVWAISCVRMHANGVKATIRLGDAIPGLMDPVQNADIVIGCPPFVFHKGYSIASLIHYIYEFLPENGVCALVIIPSFLFASDKNSTSVRSTLIGNRAIRAIVQLPAGLFNYSGINTSLIVFSKRPNKEIFFYDASAEYKMEGDRRRVLDMDDVWEAIDETTSINVPYEEINSQKALTPGQYLRRLDPNKEYDRLGDIATILRTERPRELMGQYINASALQSNLPTNPIKGVKNAFSPKGYYYRLTEPSIVFDYSSYSGRVRVGYTEEVDSEIYAARSLNVLIPNKYYSREYLMLQLLSKDVARQLKNIVVGSIFPMIKPSDLADIMIPRASLEEQAKMIQDAFSSQITESERKRIEEHESYMKEIRIRKHALSGKFSALDSRWRLLEGFIKDNGGHISTNDIIGRLHPISVKEVMNQISGFLNDLRFQVDNLADVEIDWGAPEKIFPQNFIEKYAKEHQSIKYHISVPGQIEEPFIDCDSENVEETESAVLDNSFLFPVNALTRVFDDIVANAVAHGFIDASKPDYQIVLDWRREDENIVMLISNNGSPLKDGVRPEMVLSYGYSTSLNTDGHAGIGGHEIKSIVERYGGNVEFVTNPGDEFPVTYRLTFKNEGIINTGF